jgi:osmotically inducible lipoprotein OsmB
MKRLSALLASLCLLSGCSNFAPERAATGAILGAGAGLALGSAIWQPVPGAILGAAAGAVIGGTTNTDQIDLSPPFVHQNPYR